MKKIYLFLFFCLTSLYCFSNSPKDQYVYQEGHHYITVFSFQNIVTKKIQGYVVREKNNSKSFFYQAYSAEDQFLGSAEYSNTNVQAYSANLKLYDSHGNLEGTISGEFWTTQPAKFKIATNTFNGFAYLSNDKTEFIVVDDKNTMIMQLYRHIIELEPDYWEIHHLKDQKLPDFVVKLFAAFVSDTHSQFIKDN